MVSTVDAAHDIVLRRHREVIGRRQRPLHQVAQGDETYHGALLVDHRQVSDTVLIHEVAGGLKVGVRHHRDRVFGHQVAHSQLGHRPVS